MINNLSNAQILIVGGLCFFILILLLIWRTQKKNPELNRLADILFHHQSELSGRLSQMAEYSRQQQDTIAAAINEQRLSVLKIMDEKLLQVTKNVSEGLQQKQMKPLLIYVNVWRKLMQHNKRYRLFQNKLYLCKKFFLISKLAELLVKFNLMIL